MTGFESISYHEDAGVAWLTLNRPAEANALSQQLAEELGVAIARAEANPACHVLVLSGAGRFFSAGGDVFGMAEAADPGAFLAQLARTLHEAMIALAESRLVTIAVVGGPAAGAGLGLALNADFVLASEKASFIGAYSSIGLTPDCGVSYLLPQAIGPRRAARVLLGGHRVDAHEALEWGLISELVAADVLEARAQELATMIAGSATQVLGPTKHLLTTHTAAGYAAHLRQEEAMISGMVRHADTSRRIDAFVQKSRAK